MFFAAHPNKVIVFTLIHNMNEDENNMILIYVDDS